jgi:hypothetical protein
MNWTKRGAKVLGSFVTGYSGGISVTVPIFASMEGLALGFTSMITYPIISGLVASLPQLGKILNEVGMSDD